MTTDETEAVETETVETTPAPEPEAAPEPEPEGEAVVTVDPDAADMEPQDEPVEVAQRHDPTIDGPPSPW